MKKTELANIHISNLNTTEIKPASFLAHASSMIILDASLIVLDASGHIVITSSLIYCLVN